MLWFFFVQTNIFFKGAFLFYLLAFFCYLFFAFKRKFRVIPTVILFMGWLSNTALILSYWLYYKSFPVFTLHQYLIFFVWAAISFYLVMEIFIKFRLLGLIFTLIPVSLFLWSLNALDIKKVYPPLWIENLCSALELLTMSFLLLVFFFSLLYIIFPETKELSGHWLDLKHIDFLRYVNRFLNFSLVLLLLAIFVRAFWTSYIEGKLWEFTWKSDIILLFTLLYAFSLHLRRSPKWQGKILAWVIVVGTITITFSVLASKILPIAF